MIKPDFPGIEEGTAWWDHSDPPGEWTWHFDHAAPPRFAVKVGHLALYGEPLATGLLHDEAIGVLAGMLKDPRCLTATVERLPLPGDWTFEAAPREEVETGSTG